MKRNAFGTLMVLLSVGAMSPVRAQHEVTTDIGTFDRAAADVPSVFDPLFDRTPEVNADQDA